jgi:RNA polymerase sigma-70 factor (ECF subfamily)
VMDRIDARPASPQVTARLSADASARLDSLFRLYNQRLVAFAATQVRVPADADDVVSETWLRAAASLHQLRADDSRAYGWLRAIAVRASIDHYRPRRAGEQPADWTDAVTARRLPVAPPADEDVLVWAALPLAQARVIKLAAQGLTQRAIAARLGHGRGTTGRTLHRGARSLRALALAG